MKNRMLIIGDGFVGSGLRESYESIYDVVITSRDVLDVSSKKSVKGFFDNHGFYEYVIYAAGIKDVKKCEEDPELAFLINAHGVEKVLLYAKCKKFIYISTDYVFDGNTGLYTENDKPNPTSVYGESKYLGENYTLKNSDNNIVVRTSGIYGKNCKWIPWLIQELKSDNKVVCYKDVVNSPTYIRDLAFMINRILESDYSGTIHLAGPNPIDRYLLFRKFSERFGLNTDNLQQGESNGKFPKNLSLCTKLYEKITNYRSLPVELGFMDLKNKGRL